MNIFKDLKNGDKIKRISGDFTYNGCKVKKGEVYTFQSYANGNHSLRIVEYGNKVAFDIKNFEYVEPVVYDIRKDLLPGDKIRRICVDNGDSEKAGEVYTFKCYISEANIAALKTVEYDVYASLYYFEFVERPKKEKKVETKLVTTFEDAEVGDSVWSFNNGPGKVIKINDWNYRLTVDFDNGEQDDFTVDGKLYESDLNQTLFWFPVGYVVTGKEVLIREDFKRAEYIEAMKTVAKEYIDGTHEFCVNTCALCGVTATFLTDKNKWEVSFANCAKCPWMRITGHLCNDKKTGLERATELLEWIKIYEKELEAENGD